MKRQVGELSPKERRVYDCIVDFKGSHDGNSPSIRFIGDDCDISSTSVVNYYLDQLQKKGLIERGKNDARMITVVGGTWLSPTQVAKAHATAEGLI